MQEARRMRNYLTSRPKPKGIDVVCGLKHFSIITYAVPVDRFNGIFPDRFELDTVTVDGQEKGLISVVPFIDVDFTSAVFPFPRFTMGQTNYRVYIVDSSEQQSPYSVLIEPLNEFTIYLPPTVVG